MPVLCLFCCFICTGSFVGCFCVVRFTVCFILNSVCCYLFFVCLYGQLCVVCVVVSFVVWRVRLLLLCVCLLGCSFIWLSLLLCAVVGV